MSAEGLYDRYGLDKETIIRRDGQPLDCHAPSHAAYLLDMGIAGDTMVDPVVNLSDLGTSFHLTTTSSRK